MSKQERPTVEVNIDLEEVFSILVETESSTEIDIEQVDKSILKGRNGDCPPPIPNGNGNGDHKVRPGDNKEDRIVRRRHPKGGGKQRQPRQKRKDKRR